MIGNRKMWIGTGLLTGLLILGSGTAQAQSGQAPPQNGQNPPPASQPSEKDKAQDKVQELTLDNPSPPPVNAEEDAAFKAFQDTPVTDSTKRIQLGEAFVQKYPTSRYLPPVYASLTISYLQANQLDKMMEVGEKEAALTPNDVQTLAILGQTISRTVKPGTPDAGKQLDKAEQYSKRAIEMMPTLPKPANLTEEAFTTGKNQTLAMAHSGLGLVDIRRKRYSDAIPELEQSVKLDPMPDPVNYYLLGVANQNASHYDDAVAAFNKCASMEGNLQPTCKTGAEEAKKLGATQLSSPK